MALGGERFHKKTTSSDEVARGYASCGAAIPPESGDSYPADSGNFGDMVFG
jgi:hypothetical protein